MNIKFISLLISVVLLFQSCVTVYKSKSLTLEEANDRDVKTKVVINSGEKLKFKNIVFENGIYYGEMKKKRRIIKIPLDQEAISEIKIKDRTLSTIVNISLGFVYPIIVIGAGIAIGGGGVAIGGVGVAIEN